MPSQNEKDTGNDEKGVSCQENEQKENSALPHIDISSSSESDTCSSLCCSPAVVEKVCVLEIVS